MFLYVQINKTFLEEVLNHQRAESIRASWVSKSTNHLESPTCLPSDPISCVVSKSCCLHVGYHASTQDSFISKECCPFESVLANCCCRIYEQFLDLHTEHRRQLQNDLYQLLWSLQLQDSEMQQPMCVCASITLGLSITLDLGPASSAPNQQFCPPRPCAVSCKCTA